MLKCVAASYRQIVDGIRTFTFPSLGEARMFAWPS